MKNNFNFVLIILVIILILSGAGIIFFRQELLLFLNEKSNIPDGQINEYVQEIPVEDILSSEVLNNETFNTLENQVKDFNFENVCELNGERKCIVGTARPFEYKEVN